MDESGQWTVETMTNSVSGDVLMRVSDTRNGIPPEIMPLPLVALQSPTILSTPGVSADGVARGGDLVGRVWRRQPGGAPDEAMNALALQAAPESAIQPLTRRIRCAHV